MDIQTRKIEFVQEFLKIQSEELICRLESLLQSETELKTDKEFQPMSLEELNLRIDESMEDSENGRLTKSTNLISKIENWK